MYHIDDDVTFEVNGKIKNGKVVMPFQWETPDGEIRNLAIAVEENGYTYLYCVAESAVHSGNKE